MRALFASLLLVSCVPGEIDLSGRACPCAEGWTCDEARNVCVLGPIARDAGRGDGGFDAGVDSGAVDAAFVDAGYDGGFDAGGELDAGPDDTSCDDVHAGAIFCDGFEDEALASWDGTYANLATVDQASELTYRGAGALRSETTASGGESFARKVYEAAMTSGDIYIRAYFYFPSSHTIDSTLSILQTGYDASPWHHASINIDPPGRASTYITTDTVTEYHEGGSFPRDEWVCFELHVALSETAGVVEFWMNGVRQAGSDPIDTVPALGYQRIAVGLVYTDPAETSALAYVDELVYSNARIGCD